MENNIISIIIPSYNCGRYIRKAIDSILNQSYKNKEIIVIDGGSNDGTLDILKSYKNSIKWVSEKDRGQWDAIQKGLTLSTGEIFAYLNADDWYESEIFSEIEKIFKNNKKISFVYGNCRSIKELDGSSAINTPPPHLTKNMLVNDGNLTYQPASFFRKESLIKEGGIGNYNFMMELDMNIKALMHGDAAYTNKVLANFLIRADQKSRAENQQKMIKEMLDISKKFGGHFYNKISRDYYYIYFIKRTLLKKILPSPLYNIFKKTYFYIIFIFDFKNFKEKLKKNYRFTLLWKDRYPQLLDKTRSTPFDSHYLYHPAWAARIVKQINPEFHIDISSTLNFSSMLSAFIPVHFYDYRPANILLSNLKSERADLLSLPFSDNSIKSLSCMHTVEHIGLGRYGDPIDPDGDLKAIGELKRVIAPGGSLLFVVPIGKPKIMFNAHRIYSYEQIISYFNGLKLEEFSLIPDNAQEVGILKDASKKEADSQNYGCGCFWFVKK